MPWLPHQYRGKARYLYHVPTPVEWLPIDQAIRDGFNVMLCWDRQREEWRCDFIRAGEIYHGEGPWVGAAVDLAFARLKERRG